MKIAFLENFLNVRGTTVALFDYAHYNEVLLGNQSIVITRPFSMVTSFEDASIQVYDKFVDRFPMCYYKDRDDIQRIIDNEKPDVLYVIKAGTMGDGLYDFKGVKTLVHCVFNPFQSFLGSGAKATIFWYSSSSSANQNAWHDRITWCMRSEHWTAAKIGLFRIENSPIASPKVSPRTRP